MNNEVEIHLEDGPAFPRPVVLPPEPEDESIPEQSTVIIALSLILGCNLIPPLLHIHGLNPLIHIVETLAAALWPFQIIRKRKQK